MKRPSSAHFGLLALLILAAAIYAQVAQFGYVDYDDPVYVSEQPYVLEGLSALGLKWSLTDTSTNIWHPLTWWSHMLDVEIFGTWWGGHHLTNVALHLFSTVLAYLLLFRLFPGRWGVALFGASAFCLHPLHVESVAWLSERKDVLSGIFFHLSLLGYVAYAQAKKDKPSSRRCAYLFSLISFGMGLASKSSILVLPGILVLLDLWPLRRQGFTKSYLDARYIIAAQWREKLPFALLAAAIGASGFFIQKGGSHAYWMGQGGGLISKVMSIPSHFAFYLQRTLWPTDLSFTYPRLSRQSVFGMVSQAELWGIVGVLCLLLFGYLAWRGQQRRPAILFGFGWAIIVLSLFLGALYVGTSFTNDRYTYLALTGPAAALALLLSDWGNKRRWGLLAPFLGMATVGAWAGLSYQQIGVWKDNHHLFSQAVHAQPNDQTGWVNLGSTYEHAGKDELAIEHYQRALELNPSDYITHHNLGQIYRERDGDWDKAIAAYEKAIESYPDYHPSLHNLGMSLALKNQESYDVERSIDLVGRSCEATNYQIPLYVKNYVDLLAANQRFQSAMRALERGLQFPHIDPGNRAAFEHQKAQLRRIQQSVPTAR